MKKLVAVITILAVCNSFVYFAAAHPGIVSADGSMQEAFVESLGGTKDEEVSDMVKSKDGGYYLHGFTKSFGAKGWDFLDVKVNKNGKPEWAVISGGAGDEIWNTCYSYSGGFVFTGGSTSFSNKEEEILSKVDKNGKMLWSKLLSTSASTGYGSIVTNKKDDIFIILGIRKAEHRRSFALASFSTEGNLRWMKQLNTGREDNWFAGLNIDDDDNIYTAGEAGYNNDYSGYFIKADPDGNAVFCKKYSASSNKEVRLGYGIAKAGDGFVLNGIFDNKLLVLRVDKNGEIIWAKTIESDHKIGSAPTVLGSKSGIYITDLMEYPGNAKIVNIFLNPDGTLKWAKTFGGDYRTQRRVSNFPTGVITDDGGIAFSNYCTFGNNGEDFLLVKTDSNGDVPGCKYIQDVKIKITDVTNKITAGSVANVNTVLTDLKLTVKDVNLHPRFVNLSEKKVCQPKPAGVALLTPKDKSSASIPVVLKWQDTPNADSYEVQVSDKSDFSNVILDKITEETSLTIPEDKITKGKTYYWRVRGINELNKGDWSSAFSFSTIDLPQEPTISASLSNGGATINWEQVKQGTYPIAGYAIYRSMESGKEDFDNPVATVGANTTQYTDKTVELNKTYYYIVKAFDNQTPPNYSEPSNEVKVKVKDITPQTISINSPGNFETVNEDAVTVSGTVTDDLSGIDTVTVNGSTVKLNSDGSFSVAISLTEGENTIKIVATDKAGNKTTNTVVVTYKSQIVITLQPDNPMMTVNGVSQEIDPGRGTKPVIIPKWGRTVVPIRAIVEALGGTIGWNGKERKVTINFNDTVIELWIDNPKAKVNGETEWIDPNNHNVKPIIVNSRTMLPLRFVAESLGCKVDWDAATRTITITYTP
jgi:hypothetical protein